MALTDEQCQKLFELAHQKGMEAGTNCTPVPMGVSQHANPLNDNSPVVHSWVVPDGPCGFAWVTVKPGNCKFAKFLKQNHDAYNDYYGGVSLSCSEFNQSITRKYAYCCAFARVLNENGIKACANERLD